MSQVNRESLQRDLTEVELNLGQHNSAIEVMFAKRATFGSNHGADALLKQVDDVGIEARAASGAGRDALNAGRLVASKDYRVGVGQISA